MKAQNAFFSNKTFFVLMIAVALTLTACAEETSVSIPQAGENEQGSEETNQGLTETEIEADNGAVSEEEQSEQETNNEQNQENQNVNGARVVSASELAVHNTRDDCWVAYKGEVYDLTPWIPKHPGGVGSIAQHCGTSEQFEAGFSRRHGTAQVERLKSEANYIGLLG